MDTNKKIREHISALKDGELSESDLELAFAALHSEDGRQAWEVYHRIGDVMRAEASADLSLGFTARLAARLDAETGQGGRTAGARIDKDAAATVASAASPAAAP